VAFFNYLYGEARWSSAMVTTLGLKSGDSGSDLDVVHETKVSRAMAVFNDWVLHWPIAPSAVREYNVLSIVGTN
jgi:hypothetical protein